MANWRIGILLGIVAVIAVIQVLPQVDLLDTTIHEDSLSIVNKVRRTPALWRITARPLLVTAAEAIRKPRNQIAPVNDSDLVSFLLIQHFALRC